MEVRFLRQPYKFIKKADKNLKEKIKEEIFKIQNNPAIGYKLHGKHLKEVFSHHFVFVKVHYRVAYKIEGTILIIAIASRENFYRDLKI